MQPCSCAYLLLGLGMFSACAALPATWWCVNYRSEVTSSEVWGYAQTEPEQAAAACDSRLTVSEASIYVDDAIFVDYQRGTVMWQGVTNTFHVGDYVVEVTINPGVSVTGSSAPVPVGTLKELGSGKVFTCYMSPIRAPLNCAERLTQFLYYCQ